MDYVLFLLFLAFGWILLLIAAFIVLLKLPHRWKTRLTAAVMLIILALLWQQTAAPLLGRRFSKVTSPNGQQKAWVLHRFFFFSEYFIYVERDGEAKRIERVRDYYDDDHEGIKSIVWISDSLIAVDLGGPADFVLDVDEYYRVYGLYLAGDHENHNEAWMARTWIRKPLPEEDEYFKFSQDRDSIRFDED